MISIQGAKCTFLIECPRLQKKRPPHFAHLWERTRVRVLQTGEPGPYSQAIAGIDIALWDLAARRAGKPLRHFIADGAVDAVPAYSSGIHIAIALEAVPEARAACARAGGWSRRPVTRKRRRRRLVRRIQKRFSTMDADGGEKRRTRARTGGKTPVRSSRERRRGRMVVS